MGGTGQVGYQCGSVGRFGRPSGGGKGMRKLVHVHVCALKCTGVGLGERWTGSAA